MLTVESHFAPSHSFPAATTQLSYATIRASNDAMNLPTYAPQKGPAFRPTGQQQQQQRQQHAMTAATAAANPSTSSSSSSAFSPLAMTVRPFEPVTANGNGVGIVPAATPPCSLLIRRLPLNTTEDTLRSMVVWSKEFVDAEVLAPERAEDAGFRSAVLHFKSQSGAVAACTMLDGKPNIANDAQMIVEVVRGSPVARRYVVDPASAITPASSVSSASSAGPTPRQASRFNAAFPGPRASPPTNAAAAAAYTDLPKTSAHYQSLFSPQSPIGNHLNDRTRITGKALINDDAADDETGELLKDPVAYAENGPTGQRRATNPPPLPLARMAGLSLNTIAAGPNPAAGPFAAPLSHPISPTVLATAGPPLNYQLGSQHYQRHNFPPVNPADQNPPCNTLYVGNLPIDTSEDELKAMFSKQRGYKRLCFRTKQNGPMCFVEFEDVSFATKALHELYGHPLHNSVKGGIRLSFSKNPLGVRSGPGMSSPSPASVQSPGINGIMLGPGFSTANGPPPGLSAPPGLGRMGYANGAGAGHRNGSGMAGGMNGVGSVPYVPSPYPSTNGWGGPTGLVYAGGMAAGGPTTTMMHGANTGGFPAYMMGR